MYIKEAWLLVWLAVGMMFDFRSRRVPNVWVLCGILTAVFSVFGMEGQREELYLFFVRFFAAVLCCFPLFSIRVLGAGDIKCLAVVVGVLGYQAGFFSCFCGFLIGSFIGIIKLIRKGKVKERFFCAAVYLMQRKHKEKIPYWNVEQDGYEMTMPLIWCIWVGVLFYAGVASYI